MIYTRQKSRAGANPESPRIIQHGINIHEVPTPSRTVFTLEQNELFVQRVVQDAQVLEGGFLCCRIIGLNEYETESYLKKPIINWLFDPTLTKISIHRILLLFA